jgi:hypothetical protein
MRALLVVAASSLALALAGASAAAAQEPSVTVAVGAELQSKADRLGEREIDILRKDLTREVTRGLVRSGAQRADLVLEMAKPNRPTAQQLGRTPGLMMSSVGLGGASVTGTVTLANGDVQPISYRFYDQDLRDPWLIGAATWTSAGRAFMMLSRHIGKGDLPNQGPHPVGDRRDGMFGGLRFY